MKKHILIATVLFALTSIACSSDSDEGPMNPPMNDVTYTGDIKAVVDANCIGCHGDPLTNGAPMPLLTRANVQEAIENRGLIGRIESGSMPPGNAPDLSAAQVQAVKDWQANNFAN